MVPAKQRGNAAGSHGLYWTSGHTPPLLQIDHILHIQRHFFPSKGAPNGSLWVHPVPALNSPWKPLYSPTCSRTLCLHSFRTTLNITLTGLASALSQGQKAKTCRVRTGCQFSNFTLFRLPTKPASRVKPKNIYSSLTRAVCEQFSAYSVLAQQLPKAAWRCSRQDVTTTSSSATANLILCSPEHRANPSSPAASPSH